MINTKITISTSKDDDFCYPKQNFSLFEMGGSNFFMKFENISFFKAGCEVFNNAFYTVPLTQNELLTQRGIIMRDIRFSGENNSPILKFYLSDCEVEMNLVIIENVIFYEMIGIRAVIKIEKSIFSLIYSSEISARAEFFLISEYTRIALKDFKLIGDRDTFNMIYNGYVFMDCHIECDIMMNNILINNIFLDKLLFLKFLYERLISHKFE